MTYDTSDESACIDLAKTSVVGHEDDDANNPHHAQFASCPQTTDAVGNKEGQQCTKNAANLHHSRDISFDVSICNFVECIEAKKVLEVAAIECATVTIS